MNPWETADFKRFRKFMNHWVDLALKLSQLTTRQGKHSAPSRRPEVGSLKLGNQKMLR